MKTRDVYQYKTLKQLEDAIKSLPTSKRKKQETAKGKAEKIWENDELVIIRPDDKASCVAYGKGSRWCITMQNETYYEQYTSSNVLFYFVLRKQPKGDRFDKVAFALSRIGDPPKIDWGEGLEIFDALDGPLSKEHLLEVYGRKTFEAIWFWIQDDGNEQPNTLAWDVSSLYEKFKFLPNESRLFKTTPVGKSSSSVT